MTRIDFYIVEKSAPDSILLFACRLAEKAVQRNLDVLINTASDADSRRLDDLLWTFSQGSFVPHRLIAGDDQEEPVVIGSGQEPEDGNWDLLINLAPAVPDFFSRFNRLAELVGTGEADKAAGRERFRYYRDRGYELRTHHV